MYLSNNEPNTLNIVDTNDESGTNKLTISSNFTGNFHGNAYAGNFVLGDNKEYESIVDKTKVFIVNANKTNDLSTMDGVTIGGLHPKPITATELTVNEGITEKSETGSSFNKLTVHESLTVDGTSFSDVVSKINQILAFIRNISYIDYTANYSDEQEYIFETSNIPENL